MMREEILEMIAANREKLKLNDHKAPDNLKALHKKYHEAEDEACILALSLNDSIADMIYHADYESAITNSQQVLDRFPNSKHLYLVCSHLSVIGRCETLAGRYAPAKETLIKALKITETELKRTNQSIKLSADILHDLAMNNTLSQGNPKKTILYLGKALTLLSETPFEVRKGICLMGLGNVKFSEGKNRAALRYYLKASKIFEDQSTTNNLASAYNNLGLCYANLGQMEPAERYMGQSIDIRLKLGNNDEIANSYFNLAQLYDMIKDTDKAYINLLVCKPYAASIANKKLYIDTLLWLESIALERNDRTAALSFREERQKTGL